MICNVQQHPLSLRKIHREGQGRIRQVFVKSNRIEKLNGPPFQMRRMGAVVAGNPGHFFDVL